MINRSDLKESAVKLRSAGLTFRQISKSIKVPLGTVHLWTRNIELTQVQKNKIKAEHASKFIQARKEKSKIDKTLRKQEENQCFTSAEFETKSKIKDPIFLLGLGLYWAEGFKKDHSLGFVNSDSAMVNFFLKWLVKYGSIELSDVRIRVQINSIYRNNIDEVEQYWSQCLGIPLGQFQKPFFSVSKKYYVVDPNHYGLVRVRVPGTRRLFVKILGWVSGAKTCLR